MKTHSASSTISVAKISVAKILVAKISAAYSLMTALVVAIAVASAVLGTPARAQTPAPAPAVPSQPKVNLTLEQRYVIKELIKDLDVSPAQQNVETTVGATVPAMINLNPMPQTVAQKVPQVKSHLFFLKDGKVVIVDPKENKIVDAIE
jgi:Protein of unknown function (DUF1236)